MYQGIAVFFNHSKKLMSVAPYTFGCRLMVGMGGNGLGWQNAEKDFCSGEWSQRAIGRVHGRRLLSVGWQNERMVVGAFS